MRIAWFSPLNTADAPIDSISAYASDLLLPLLKGEHDIELFHNSFENYTGFPTYHCLNAFLRHKEKPFDVFFYQLEDRPCSRFLRIASALMPGVVWFHDLLFLDYGPEPVLNSSWRQTLSRFQGKDLKWPERGAEFEQEGPLGFREAGVNFLSLFSSERDHDEYRRNITARLADEDTLKSCVLPLPVDLSALPAAIESSEKALRVGFVGAPRIEHRCYKFFEALSALTSRIGSNSVELVWCCAQSEKDEAAALLSEFGLTDQTTLIPERSPARWAELLSEVDIAVHTLFSVFGQSGPYLQMSLGAGKPVIANRFASNAFYADDVLFLIDAGAQESIQYQEVFDRFLSGQIGKSSQTAIQFASEVFDHRVIAAELDSVFEQNQASLQTLMQRWSGVMGDARDEIHRELQAFLGDSAAMFEATSHPGYSEIYKELGW